MKKRNLLSRIFSCLVILLVATLFRVFLYSIELHHQLVLQPPSSSSLSVDSPFRPLGLHSSSWGSRQHDRNESTSSSSSSSSSKDVHIVFSTDCSGYQHWQSIAIYYSLLRIGHRGPITRVVSGCATRHQEQSIANEFEAINLGRRRWRKDEQQHGHEDENRKLRVHFTPSFALEGKHYKYSNKPGGLKHWMDHVAITEPLVALVDPDMMFLRPVAPDLGRGLERRSVLRRDPRRNSNTNLVEYVDAANYDAVHQLQQAHLPPLPDVIAPGHPVGQHFGIGGVWASSNTTSSPKDFRFFDTALVCGRNSPCVNHKPAELTARATHYTTRQEANLYYAVGPVYIASTLPNNHYNNSNNNKNNNENQNHHHATSAEINNNQSDWQSLLIKWQEFMPRVHQQYPKLLAEMYAFSMAAADRQLHFGLASSFMASDPTTMSTTESWLWVDEYYYYGRENKDFQQQQKQQQIHEKQQQNQEKQQQQDGRRKRNGTRAVCEGATSTSLPSETLRRIRHQYHLRTKNNINEEYGYGEQDNNNNHENIKSGISGGGGGGGRERGGYPLPTTLHYCQNYKFANHTFAKRKVPHDFFKCDGRPMKFDIDVILQELDRLEEDDRIGGGNANDGADDNSIATQRGGVSSNQIKIKLRTAFMICHLIPLMNMALRDYKLDVCNDESRLDVE